MIRSVCLLVLLVGCAQPPQEEKVLVIPAQRWWRAGGVSLDEVKLNAAQCRESAFAVPNVTYTHRRVLYEACMEGRGLTLRE